MKKVFICAILTVLCSCSGIDNKNSVTTGAINNKTKDCNEVARSLLEQKVYYPLGIIGATEPVYLKNMSSVFLARIDTGAETSSIDASDIKEFERDGESWVSFKVKNRVTNEEKILVCD